jgi:hypothetical protein
MNKSDLTFVNGLLNWTPEILDISALSNMAKNFSEYTKEILEFNSRDDDELIEFYNKLNSAASALDTKQWPNMFTSLISLRNDVGTDDSHPGPKSHKLYADMIINYLEDKNV